MTVALVAKGKKALACFDGVKPELCSPEGAAAAMARGGAARLYYVDIASFAKAAWSGLRARLMGSRTIRWAVIDRAGAEDDVPALFHGGALDYLGPQAGEGCVGTERLERVFAYAELLSAGSAAIKSTPPISKATPPSVKATPPITKATPPSVKATPPSVKATPPITKATPPARAFPGWDKLVSGRDYDVLLVCLSLAGADSMKRSLGDAALGRLKKAFLAMAASLAAESGGIVWMGDGQCALMLFPESRAGDAFAACARLLADRVLVGAERLGLERAANFSLAFHRGSCPWQEPGKTGTVVADAVNFVFHLARKHAQDGMIDLSEDAAALLPERMRAELRGAGRFEGKAVSRFTGFTYG